MMQLAEMEEWDVLEEHRAKKAAKEYEQALTAWQADRDAQAQLLDVAQNFDGTGAENILLKSGEAVFYKVTGVALVEDRRGPGHYAGRSQGVSIPIGSLKGRTVRYRVGVNKGHFVQGAPVATAIDTGTCFITNQRVIFQGGKQTRECAFAKLVGYEHDDADGSTTFSVSNRQKPTTIHYGRELSGSFDFRCDLALAHFRGTLDEFVSELKEGLDELDRHRPPEPAQVQTPTAVTNPPTQPAPEPPAMVEQPVTPESPVEVVSAGWYADPWHMASLRWWDGTAWSGYTHDEDPPPTST